MQSTDLLEQWRKGIRIWHIAHSRAAVSFARRGRLLGLLVVGLTASVGTGLFAAESPANFAVAGGIMSAAAAVLASLQTFLNYSELAERHRLAAQRYGELRREVEMYLASGVPADPQPLLDQVRGQWDEIESASVSPPQKIFDQAQQRVDSRYRKTRTD